MNSITLTGRISKKDVITKKQHKILKLSIADKNRDKLNWINDVGFNVVANYGEKYLNIGDLIQIVGVLKIDRIESKKIILVRIGHLLRSPLIKLYCYLEIMIIKMIMT